MPSHPLPANPNVQPSRYSPFWFRFFEILPGACVWTALILPFFLSIHHPLVVTLFIIAFDSYWLVQAFNYGYVLIRGYRRMKATLSVDWRARLEQTQLLDPAERERRQIADWRELYQAVILVMYKEELATLDASIQSIVDAGYPSERTILVLATEGRAGADAQEKAAALKKKFARHFHRFIVTVHPDGIVGEVKAKGANATWGAKELVRQVEAEGIAPEQVIVSTADADSHFSSAYFFCLAYAYATLPNRTRCCYQPIATYFNNIWQTPLFSRVLAFGDTFWTMIESVRDYRLISFSTHAVSLRTLIDMDYWCTSIVNEDSRQFFRAYFRYKGDFRVVPLFVPIQMDAVHAGSLMATARNLYLQKQRWAYGVEHFPYIVLECWQQREIPLLDRLMLIWRAFQGAFSWATSSFFITVVGWIPILLNPGFRDQVVVTHFVTVTNFLLSFTWVGLLISSVITIKILTLQPHDKRPGDFLVMILQWALTPVVGLIFGALPGLDAQTRLMLGRYIGFRVTEKAAS